MQTVGKLTYSDYEFTMISTMTSAISSSRSAEIDKCKEKKLGTHILHQTVR